MGVVLNKERDSGLYIFIRLSVEMGWNNLNTSYLKHKLQTFLGAFKASHYLLCLPITCE